MADIRETGVLDNFDAYPASPVNTTQYPVQSLVVPWYTSPGSNPVKINSGGIGGTEFPPSSSLGYYSAVAVSGDGWETWGIASGSPGETAGWRWGAFTVTSLAVDYDTDGYQALPQNNIGPNNVSLRRLDNGSATTIGTSAEIDLGGTGTLWLMRRRGDNIEVWQSTDSGANWTMHLQVNDTTYMGPFHFCYGTTGIETGWGDIGGGAKNRQHIYRWLKGR